MSLPRHLSAAPIVEGIIDIQFKAPVGLNVSSFRKLAERFKLAQRIEEMQMLDLDLSTGLSGEPPTQQKTSSTIFGIRCFSPDGKVVVQLRKNGFTFSRLAPYSSWDEVFPQAADIYQAFHQISDPIEISRIAVRNVNRLMLPPSKAIDEPGSFLINFPVLPQLPVARASQWMTRVLVEHPSLPIMGILTQLTEDSIVNGARPVIFDIDVFETQFLPLEPKELLPKFHALRQWKNELFFSSLTEDCLRSFK